MNLRALKGRADTRFSGRIPAVITLQTIRKAWLKARIAYHRRQAEAYGKPVVRSFKRDSYAIWTRTMAMRHAMKAQYLERRLAALVAS